MNVLLLAIAAGAAQTEGGAAPDEHLRDPLPRPAQQQSGTLFSDDYPMSAIRAGAQGAVVMRLSIGTSGRIERCEVVASTGYEPLDDATCRLASRRFRFLPALGADGRPIASALLRRVIWTLPTSTRTVDRVLEQHLREARPGRARLRGAPASFDYPAAALRARAQGTAVIRFIIGVGGIVHSCSIEQSSGNDDLDVASCVMAFNHLLYFPAIGPEGRPTEETRTQSINWRLPDAAQPTPPDGG